MGSSTSNAARAAAGAIIQGLNGSRVWRRRVSFRPHCEQKRLSTFSGEPQPWQYEDAEWAILVQTQAATGTVRV